MQLTLGVLANLPIGTPISIGKEKSSITATASAFVDGCDVTADNAGKVSGTVTFTRLEEWVAQGSVDLRIEGAEGACDVSSSTTIEYTWGGFNTSVHDSECFD